MKPFKLLIFFVMLAFTLSAQPPNPALLYRQTEPNPTFIKVSGITAEFADAEDYIFTYGSANRCYGATRLYSDPVFVAAMGNDSPSGVSGFSPGEVIQVGIYDAQTGRFYKLTGQAYNYLTTNETTLTWHPLSLYTYEVTLAAGEATLMIDKELAAVKLAILAPTVIKVKDTKELFIKVDEQNVKNVALTKSGGGTLQKAKRWVTGQGWTNYIYTISENEETSVTFTATGQSAWDRSVVTATHTVAIDRDYFNANAGVVFVGKYYQIVKDAGGLYLETTADYGVRFMCKIGGVIKTTDINKAKNQPGNRALITADDVSEIQLYAVRYMGTNSSTKYIDDDVPRGYSWSRAEFSSEIIKLK